MLLPLIPTGDHDGSIFAETLTARQDRRAVHGWRIGALLYIVSKDRLALPSVRVRMLFLASPCFVGLMTATILR
jgi:hypothetical protein